MPAFISIEDMYVALEAALSRLSSTTAARVQETLYSSNSEERRLCFIPLHSGMQLEVRPPGFISGPGGESYGEPLFLAALLRPAAVADVLERGAVAGDSGAGGTGDLVDVLERFHFFAHLPQLPGECLSPELSAQVLSLQRLRAAPGAELYGEHLSFRLPVVLSVVDADTLDIAAIQAHDPLPAGHIQHAAAPSNIGGGSLVVLSTRNIRIHSEPLVHLVRPPSESAAG
jgi:hypothetical protein